MMYKFDIVNITFNDMLIYLPDELINQEILQQFMRILKINININAILPSRF
jgi:hypothetical protein